MARILVTGGAGNIGSALTAQLVINEEHRVVVADNLSTGAHHKLPKHPYVTFIKADVNRYTDMAPLFSRYHFDYVFHFAAVVGVQRTLSHPIAVLNDIEGIKHILTLSKNSGVKRVFYSSSSEVYGEPFEFPQNENTTPLNSRLPYAIVKNAGEAFLKAYQQEYGLDYTIFRFFNTYGPYQTDDFVIPRFLKTALKHDPITIYGTGSQTRTFCYIADAIEVCLKILSTGSHANSVLNVGNDTEISILELAQHIIAQTRSGSPIVHVPALPEGDMNRRCPDIGQMKALLQRELTPLDTGLQYLIEAYTTKAL